MSRKKIRLAVIAAFSALLLALSPVATAGAGHDDDPRTKNLHPMGHIEEPASLFFGPPSIHTDIAFWGRYAFQGNWQGFNIRDVSAPGNPKHISFTSCNGNQGDVIVWDNVLVRSWNSPADGTQDCDGTIVPAGFEGVHIFDVSDVKDPALVGSVETECGSHTATGVPDLANNRLLVYNSSASGACPGIDIIEVPLDNPAAASYLSFVDAGGRDCHDTGVILGDAMKAACAGDDGFSVWSLANGLDAPALMYSRSIDGVGIGHSAMFTWDGEVIVFGHEPGGGVGPFCQETTADIDKSAMFFDTDTGDMLGMWTLPRPQSDTENCTIHNYNIVPVPNGNYILVSGNYQSGTSVVDFTDPANAVELAYSDPPAIDPLDLGGAWSSYWYNNFIYETNITEGLNIFRFSGKATAGALKLDHLNPQTMEFTIP